MTSRLLTAVPKVALISLIVIIAVAPFVAQRTVAQRPPEETAAVTSPTVPLTQTMGITQTLSDEAQRNTIAFDGLAFLTGSLGADSFFLPGKVADFWGFQYLRDNDPSGMGHNPLFLTSAAFNMWNVLTDTQRAQLKTLANAQVNTISEYGYKRFVLMKAFRRLLEGDVPTGSAGLDKSEVMAYSADLYRLDGQMSYDRAKVMGGIIASLSPSQTNFLNTYMVGKGMLQWPAVTEPADMQGLDRPVKEALMTYAGDIYSWYTGSLEADVYFCPERQGTYFGSFYLKDTPVMSVGGSIDTNLTANAGITFVLTLTPTQKTLVTGLVDIQRTDLNEIVARRQDMSTAFRRFIAGQPVSLTEVLSQANRYGELDGEIVYNIATNFAALSRTLTTSQRATFNGLRQQILNGFPLTPEPNAYLYSDQIAMPTIPNTDFLFLPALTHKVYLPLVGVNIGAVITPTPSLTPTLPDTGQVTDYTATFGEDADYSINPPTYTVNGNGTVVRKQKCPRGHCDLKPMLRMSSRTPLKVRKQKCPRGHCDASAYSGLVVFVLGEKTKMPARALRQTVRYASATKLLCYPAENKNAGEAPGLCDSQRRLNAVRLDKVRQFWTTFWCVLLVPLVGENRLMFFATELDFLLVRERNPWRCGSLLAA